jgi:hypothetical protein
MDKQLIFSEIESIIFDIETSVKSLANSREYIAESDYSRATSQNFLNLKLSLQTIGRKSSLY